MKTFFVGDGYRTPPDAPVSAFARLTGGWRWAFYLRYFGVVLHSRRLAIQGLLDDEAWADRSLDVMRATERHGARYEVSGLDILRDGAPGAPYVFVANHMSTLETHILPVLIAPFMPVTFVVKESLVKGDVFGPIMRSRDPIVVGRRNPREDLEAVLGGGVDRLKRGVSIVVFPQSTRTPVFRPEAFNTLGIKLAAKAGVPVIPVALKTDFWGDQGLFRGFGPIRPERTVHIEFARPLQITGRGKDQHQKIVELIESRLELWGAGRAGGRRGLPD